MMKYAAIAAGVAILGLGIANYFLFERVQTLNKRQGELEESNRQLTETVNAKIKAAQGRAQTDNAVRRLDPPAKLDRLR